MPIKPRRRVNRLGPHSVKPQQVLHLDDDHPAIEIEAWSPAEDGSDPTQVHLVIHPRRHPLPIVVRFKSPDTLGFLIEELARYRQLVWPAAAPVELKNLPPPKTDEANP